jgi:FixJ family two-component response regulator
VVIDDDSAVLASLRFSLELEGFSVDAYRAGAELLAQATHPKSGCLVIDYNLPDINGLDLLAALRRSGVTLPAILVTTNPSAFIRGAAAAARVPIVEKPLLGNALVDGIRDALAGASTTS